MKRGRPPDKETNLDLPSIGIPGEVLFHIKLTETEKILFGFLRSLAQKKEGCWASNKYLALLMGKEIQTIVNAVAKLKQWKFITAEYSYRSDGAQIRHISVNPTPKPLLKYLYPIKILIGGVYKNINSNIREDKNKEEEEKEYIPSDWKSLGKKYDSPRVRFVKQFLDAQKSNWPKKIKDPISPNCTRVLGSLECLDKLCRIDGYDFDKDIRPILEQVPDHDFWSGVILSLATLRSKSKNGETKFVNLCTSIERDAKSAPPSKQQLMDWYLAKRQKPDDKELKRLSDSDKDYENSQARRWRCAPSAKKLVKEYEEWLKKQDWINSPGPTLFKPTNQIFKNFLAQYQKDLGVDFITGRNI